MTAAANRKHKDSMFRDLFGSPERKGNALELYNALAGTSYADPGELELTTLDDVIYMNVKNDVSFLQDISVDRRAGGKAVVHYGNYTVTLTELQERKEPWPGTFFIIDPELFGDDTIITDLR